MKQTLMEPFGALFQLVRLWVCIGGLIVLGLSSPSVADEKDLKDDRVFESEIIVTARRIAQKSEDYAGSIQVLDASRLETVSNVHPAELFNAVAGVNIHRGSGQEHLTAIRSPVLTGGAGAGSFLYLEDGIPIRAAGFSNVNGLFEGMIELADRAEIAKGPGSVIYGSNAQHGLINILSNPPGEGQGRHVTIWSSDDDLVSLKGTFINPSTSIGLSWVKDGGFRDQSGFEQQKAQFRWDNTFGPWEFEWLTSVQNLNQETAGFIQGPSAYKDEAVRLTNPNPEAYRDGQSFRSQFRLFRHIGSSHRIFITPYMRGTHLEFLRHFVPGQAREESGHVSVGIVSALHGPDYIIGIDGEYTNGFVWEYQDHPPRFSFIQGAHYDYKVRNWVGAAYAEKSFPIFTDGVVSAGLRIEYTDFHYDNQIDSGIFGRFKRIDDRRDSFFSATPKVAILYPLSESLSLYGRLARGARAPQVTDLYSLQINQEGAKADIETLDSLEVGLKGQVGEWKIDLAAYRMWKDNFFFRNSDGFNVVDGKTRHEGVELSFNAPLSSDLTFSGDMSWALHTYNFEDHVASASNSIMKGEGIDSAPKSLMNFRLSADITDKFETEIEWRHVGAYALDPGNTHEYPGHDIFVLRSQWQVNEAIKLMGRIDNLTDRRYADRADYAFGTERYFPGRPRTLFLGLTSGF